MTKTATKSKTTDKTLVKTIEAKALREMTAKPLLDAYLSAEDRAAKTSARKKTSKAALMAGTEHGDKVTATDGRVREIEQYARANSGWENAARQLAAAAGMSDAALEKLAKRLGTSTQVKEVKKV